MYTYLFLQAFLAPDARFGGPLRSTSTPGPPRAGAVMDKLLSCSMKFEPNKISLDASASKQNIFSCSPNGRLHFGFTSGCSGCISQVRPLGGSTHLAIIGTVAPKIGKIALKSAPQQFSEARRVLRVVTSSGACALARRRHLYLPHPWWQQNYSRCN
jgi:hypothetical protein